MISGGKLLVVQTLVVKRAFVIYTSVASLMLFAKTVAQAVVVASYVVDKNLLEGI